MEIRTGGAMEVFEGLIRGFPLPATAEIVIEEVSWGVG
jgi:hypothetical protein